MVTTPMEEATGIDGARLGAVAVEQPLMLNTIHHLLSEFAEIFNEPQGLPPQCEFDHSIPLLPGA